MAFVTDVREFQALLDAYVSVRDWETLTECFIFIGLLAPFTPYNIVSLH